MRLQSLLIGEGGLIPDHDPQDRSREAPAGPLDIAQSGQHIGMREFPPIRKTAAPEPPQIPWQIEESKLPGLPRALEPPYAFGIEVFGSIHMASQGFAHDKRPEDIGRALADAIHFRIADQLLDAERRFASQPFRFGGFIAHAPEDDLGIPDKTDRVFGTEDLRDRRFDPDVVAMLIG